MAFIKYTILNNLQTSSSRIDNTSFQSKIIVVFYEVYHWHLPRHLSLPYLSLPLPIVSIYHPINPTPLIPPHLCHPTYPTPPIPPHLFHPLFPTLPHHAQVPQCHSVLTNSGNEIQTSPANSGGHFYRDPVWCSAPFTLRDYGAF